MINKRPSFGEFSGYFNICKADYDRFGVGDWKKKVICDQHFIPRLTFKENNAAKDAVAEVLLEVGYLPSDLEVSVAYLWPQFFFSIERSQIDRSVRLYLSSVVLLTTDLVEHVRLVLRSQFPTWRVVVVLPAGNEPDLVIYTDLIRIGDQVGYSVAMFESMKASWLAAENHSFATRSLQILRVNHALPTLYLNQQRSIFLVSAFGWSYNPSPSQMDFTVWFACVGKKRGDPFPHRIETLQIDSREYPASSPVLFGLLDKDGRWTFVGAERSKGHCCYFLVPPFSSQTEFSLYGCSDSNSKKWRFSGEFGNLLQTSRS